MMEISLGRNDGVARNRAGDLMLTRACRGDGGCRQGEARLQQPCPPAPAPWIQSPEQQKPQQQQQQRLKGDSSQRDSRHAQCEQQQHSVMDQGGLITFGTVGDVLDVTKLSSDESPGSPRDGEVITEDLVRVETKGEEVAGGESEGPGGIVQREEIAGGEREGGVEVVEIAGAEKKGEVEVVEIAGAEKKGVVEVVEIAGAEKKGVVEVVEIAGAEKKGEVEVVEIAGAEKKGEVEVVEIAGAEKKGEVLQTVEAVEIAGGSEWEGVIPLGKERKLLGSWCADADAAARKRLMQAPAVINQTENPGLVSARTEHRRTTNAVAALTTRAPLGSKNRATPVTTNQPIRSFTRNVPADLDKSRRKASVPKTRSPPTPAPEVSHVRTTCQVRSLDVYRYTPPPPTVMMTTTSSLTLKWQHVPDEDNTVIVYTYTLEMLKDGAWTSVYNGHGLWYKVGALAPGSEYSFRVRAHTFQDSSAPSAGLVARTHGTTPGAVQAMNAVGASGLNGVAVAELPPSTPPTAKVKLSKKPKVKANKETTGLKPCSLKKAQEIQAWWWTSVLCATIVAAGVVSIGLVSLF